SWVTAFSYVNEPGLSFPRRYLNLRSTYSTAFEIFAKKITPFLGVGFTRSRNPLSGSSDYNTRKVLGGFRAPLTENLSYRLSYEYNWLEEKLSGERGHPALLETGIDYRWNIVPELNVDLGAFYRDEENTGLTHGFLSGEDSVEGFLRINFTPAEDIELFAEGRVRKVWGDPTSIADYLEGDFMMGSRFSWDTFFTWNPRGKISGMVFKDLNANGKREEDEAFLEAVKVNVGKKVLTTDRNGYFSTAVRGKKVRVVLDEQTLPQGYILTTPATLEIEITPAETFLNFGASAFSSIYGTVFYDANSNGRVDPQDRVLTNAILYLAEEFTVTNLEGTYYFRNLEAGHYLLRLDLDSLPPEFIPNVPLKKEIDLSEGINYNYSFPLRKK
ncbi:MAG: MSCRAMM family adhesin SdrC, partial [Omnitrophica bacterium]|nr:MSCRAMM family adhesin SdrC [Candidatus Omnitrophota bacterium]